MEESAVFAVALVGFAFAIASRRIEAGPLSVVLHGVTATRGLAAYRKWLTKSGRDC